MQLVKVSLLVFIFSFSMFAQWYFQNPYPTGNNLICLKFVNSEVGWAVGEFGTILKTTNGGTTWKLQFSGTTHSLNGVSFTDEYTEQQLVVMEQFSEPPTAEQCGFHKQAEQQVI